MDRILTGRDMAARHGLKDYRSWLIKNSTRLGVPWNGKVTKQDPVLARIDFGRWIADCGCGGAEYVDPDEKIFYCQNCGNVDYKGAARAVIFPENRSEIENTVLERAVDNRIGTDAITKTLRVRLLDGIPRSWDPGETVEDLKRQHRIAKQARRLSNGL